MTKRTSLQVSGALVWFSVTRQMRTPFTIHVDDVQLASEAQAVEAFRLKFRAACLAAAEAQS